MNDPSNQPDKPERWEAAFRQWGNRPQPEPQPFFYTRLQARLNQSVNQAAWLPLWLRQPAYAYAALALLLLLNVGAALHLTRTADAVTDTDTPAILTLQDHYPVDDYALAYE